MLRNYFKIAIRQMLKQKMFSVIKIGGFALGIAACLLITLYIRHELSYDRDYPNADRIYRLVGELNNNGTIHRDTYWQAPVRNVLKTDFPEVEKVGRLMASSLFRGAGSNQVRRADQVQNTYEEGFIYADQEILDILQIRMVFGDRSHALTEPNTLVLSKRKADRYFPGQNPVGKILYLNDDKSRPYRVGAVMQNFPENSHLQNDFLLTLKGIEFYKGEQTNWLATNYQTYLLVRPGTDKSEFEKKLTRVVLIDYMMPAFVKGGNKFADLLTSAKLILQPVSDIHLQSNGIEDGLPHGDIRFIWLFGGVACFILLIACINFINLSTAKSANRAKEIGLRKVVGSNRRSLIMQFLTESALFSFLSFGLAVLLAWLLMPFFNTLSGKSLIFPYTEWWLMPVLISAATIIGIIAGLYPSLYLSSFKPASVLKGQVSRGSKSSGIRGGLVIFQFTTSIILIIGTGIIYKQMQFIMNAKLGYDKEQVVIIQGAKALSNQMPAFKNELLKLSGITSVSVSDYLPVSGTKRDQNLFWKEGKTIEDSPASGQFWEVDTSYIKTMGMKLVAGKNFSKDVSTAAPAIIINQTLAKKLNLKNPVGKRITNNFAVFQVIGVVEDFNFESLKSNIGGLSMIFGNSSSVVSVKVNATNMSHLIQSISSIWKTFAHGQPIRYTFLNENYANMYADVQRMGNIFGCFAVLAIVVACLGLFALSAFMAEQRTKEIDIRKVLGASVKSITTMLSKDFIKLIFMAILIASPIAWYAMNKWLQDFAYRIEIEWWMFLMAGSLAILIALITVGFQAIKAAMMNPVKSLRTE